MGASGTIDLPTAPAGIDLRRRNRGAVDGPVVGVEYGHLDPRDGPTVVPLDDPTLYRGLSVPSTKCPTMTEHEPRIDLGVLVAHSPGGDPGPSNPSPPEWSGTPRRS